MRHFQRPDDHFGKVTTGVAAGSSSGLQKYTADVIEALQHIPVAVTHDQANEEGKPKKHSGDGIDWQWPIDWERKHEKDRKIGKYGQAIRFVIFGII
jgi:hypothetical protein